MAKLGKTISNVIRGDTRTINLTFLQANGTTPVALTGGTVYFTVQSSADPADDTATLMFQLTATDATPFTAPTLGQHTFTLSHANTNIAPATYWYDAQFKDALGSYLSSYRGKFIVQSDVTRT
jgi:hypothetical protein